MKSLSIIAAMDRLTKIAEQIENHSLPPVHLWKPDVVGEIDIRIDFNGHWYHEGELIKREPLVKLFASILWFEDENYYLVTPVEKLAIDVEDTPYIIHQMECLDNTWLATTNTHEQLFVGLDHPVELREYQQQWIPYIKVRYDLWARVNRSIYYQWVDEAMQEKKNSIDRFLLSSGSYEFEVARMSD